MEELESFISVLEIDESVVDEQKQNIYEFLSKADATTQRKILFFSTGSNVTRNLHKKSELKQSIAMQYLVAPAPTKLLFQSR